MSKSGLTSDDLVAGRDIDVDLGAGARVRGQVVAVASKNMVWIPQEPGSNIPGRWVQQGSVEHKAAAHHNSHLLSLEAVRPIQR